VFTIIQKLPLVLVVSITFSEFWGLVPQRVKSNSELQFFHIHLHLFAPHLFLAGREQMDTDRKQIQLTNSLPGNAVSSTRVEGEGLKTVPV